MAHTYTIPAYSAGYDTAADAFDTDVITYKRERYETFSPQTASYTLVAGDDTAVVTLSNGSANNLTVPPNSAVAFPVGTTVTVIQTGAGQTTVVAGAGVTVNHAAATLKLTAQYSLVRLLKTATDVWVASGDLAAA